MKNFYLISFLICALLGCATIGSIEEDYAAVDFSNGINLQEALAVAKKDFLQSEAKGNYTISSAEVLGSLLVKKYPEHWFVSFDPKKEELMFWRWLTVVDKQSGEVIFSSAYVPYDVVDYGFVFEK